jgi:hypothetical protein
MAWQLQNRLGTLPGVLAGPILRQVTPTSVSVWFAVQDDAQVTAALYDFTTSPIRRTPSPAHPRRRLKLATPSG